MNRREVDISFLMSQLNITREQAINLIAFDAGTVFESPVSYPSQTSKNIVKKSGIQEDELSKIKEILSAGFSNGESFKSRDVSEVIAEELSITTRAVPSRLKRLVESNFLEDIGGSPKSYKIL